LNAGRLLQGFDDVGEQAFFDLVAARIAASVAARVAARVADIFANKEVADYALALLVHKEGVAEDAAPLDGGVPRKNLGVHVAQNHLRGNGVIPREQASPHGDLVFQQRSKVGGSEVSEIEDFHKNQVLRSQVLGKPCARSPSRFS